MDKNIITRREILNEHIIQSDLISIEENDELHTNKRPLGVKVSTFCIICSNPQQKLILKNTQKVDCS